MVHPELASEAQDRSPRRPLLLGGGAALFLLFFVVGSALGGEPGQLMAASLNALPFAVLAVLAYLGVGRPNWAWIATGSWLLVILAGASLSALGLSIAALAGGPLTGATAAQLSREDWLRVGLIVLGMLAGVVAGALLLLPPVRRRVARVLPIDPTSFVHAVALVTVVTLSLICLMPLIVLGAPPFTAIADQLSGDASGRDDSGQIRDLIYGLIWTIPATFLAVGYGVSRSLPATIQRLGFVRPSLRQVGAALLIALLLVGAVQLLGLGIEWLWGLLGWPVTDNEAFSQLISFAINPLGAVVIGVTAGLGEELAMRGVLQPRLGLLLSNGFFMSLHALQYNWDAMLIVFVVGTACGVVRNRSNTSTAAIVHGVYNFTLIMLASAGLGS